jgi:hypothetical protein
MTVHATSDALLRALRRLLPNASLSVTQELPWCSLTFSGTQLCIAVTISCKAHSQIAKECAQTLPEYDFSFGSQLVADIAVSEHIAGDNESCLTIQALLLDD